MEPRREKPLVTISVFLFGRPAWEIDRLEGSPVDFQLLDEIASCGQALNSRLERASEIGRRLIEKGWEGVGLLYDIDFYKEITLRDAEDELKAVGIEPDEVSIREDNGDSQDGTCGP